MKYKLLKLVWTSAAVALAARPAIVPAVAQAWDGPGAQPVHYPLMLGAPEQLGDGSNAHGGTPPAANRVASIPSNFDITPWLDPNCNTVGGINCSSYTTVNADEAHQEAKFRSQCTMAKSGWYDPILYPGKDNAGHPHMFFGNTAVSKNSTYASLRTSGDSTCAGGEINRSAYWVPCLMYGSNKCLIADWAVVYYNIPRASERGKYVPFPPGFAYVAGVNPADPNDNRTRNEIAAQNALHGSTPYVYPGTSTWWNVIDAAGHNVTQSSSAPNPNTIEQPYFRSSDGSWHMNVPAGGTLIMNVTMPQCWDGKNLTSPNARDHVRQLAYQAQNQSVGYCPNGWYRIPQFEFRVLYSVSDAEVASGNLYLSSDRMDPNPVNWVAPGTTIHNDWLGAWDMHIMHAWEANCNGISDVPGQNPSPAHSRQGNDTAYCDGRRGITNQTSPTGRGPQINIVRQSTRGVYRFFLVTTPTGPASMNMTP